MTAKDNCQYKHGSYKVAGNRKHLIVAYGWLDGNPVHLMSTADGTGLTYIKQQIQISKQSVNALKAIPRYDNAMQAVDCIDHIINLFALMRRYHFKKQYKQMIFVFVDFGMTNGNQHFSCNIQRRKQIENTGLYVYRTLAMI
eukprot:3734156-Ditylum_brightwellii.AAC.1